jgi:hypothetical protein
MLFVEMSSAASDLLTHWPWGWWCAWMHLWGPGKMSLWPYWVAKLCYTEMLCTEWGRGPMRIVPPPVPWHAFIGWPMPGETIAVQVLYIGRIFPGMYVVLGLGLQVYHDVYDGIPGGLSLLSYRPMVRFWCGLWHVYIYIYRLVGLLNLVFY